MCFCRKNNIESITVLLICMFLASACTNWSYTHVFHVNGVFLIDSMTAGIVATEWDADIPSSAWKESTEFNVKQKLYKYSFASKTIAEIADLAATSPAGYGEADYSYPWVVYRTSLTGSRRHAFYNMNETYGFILDEKTEVSPVEICPGGFFIYRKASGCGENNIKSSYLIYAINEKK